MLSQADAIVAVLRRETAKACKALILEIDANLRQATPVKTGHARANWVPSVGEPAQGEDDGAAHDSGVASVLSYKLDDGALYEANNVPYIQRLDLGSSTQAPAGFIEAAIDQALVTIQGRYAGAPVDVTTQGAGTFSDTAGGYAATNVASAYSPHGGAR